VIIQSIPFALIFLTILAGIFFNNRGLHDLKADMNRIESNLKADISRIDTRLNGIQSDLTHFYGILGKLEGRVDALEKRIS
jgi:hypothetical protein